MLAEVPGDVREDGHHDVGGGRVGGHLGDKGDDHADDGGNASNGDVLGWRTMEDCGGLSSCQLLCTFRKMSWWPMYLERPVFLVASGDVTCCEEQRGGSSALMMPGLCHLACQRCVIHLPLRSIFDFEKLGEEEWE